MLHLFPTLCTLIDFIFRLKRIPTWRLNRFVLSPLALTLACVPFFLWLLEQNKRPFLCLCCYPQFTHQLLYKINIHYSSCSFKALDFFFFWILTMSQLFWRHLSAACSNSASFSQNETGCEGILYNSNQLQISDAEWILHHQNSSMWTIRTLLFSLFTTAWLKILWETSRTRLMMLTTGEDATKNNDHFKHLFSLYGSIWI